MGEPFTLAGFIKMFLAEIKMFNEEDVAGAIMPSDKAYGLINMFAMTRGEYRPGKFPMAFTTYEGHHLLWRLLEQGPVEVELNMQNSFSGVPVEVSNTVAEIRGTEKPDEVSSSAHTSIPGISARAPPTTARARSQCWKQRARW